MLYVAVFFIIIGTILLLFSNKISNLQYLAQTFFFKPLFGWLINFDDPKIKTYYRWYVIYGGVLALLIGIIVLLESWH